MTPGTVVVTSDPLADNAGKAYALPTYTRGASAAASVTFRLAGVPADPTTITFQVTRGDGFPTTFVYPAASITRASAGVYTLAIDTTPANGRWLVRIVGGGAVQAATEYVFEVMSGA